MSRRIGFLSLALLLVGGFIWWSALPDPVVALENPVTPANAAHSKDHAKPSFPAPPPGRAEGVFDLHIPGRAEQKIQAALVDPQGVDIEFIDTPLRDAMAFIADAHDITIILDNLALEEAGVSSDEPITRTLSGVKLKSALNIMLNRLGLTYVIEDEVLKVTTISAADEKRMTRVYNTGYLRQIGVKPEALGEAIQAVVEPGSGYSPVRKKPVAANGENATVLLRNPQTSSGSRGFGAGEYSPGRSNPLLKTVQYGEDKPAKVVKAESNAIQVLGDMLVVSAPRRVHEKIGALLIQVDRRWAKEHGKK